MSRPPFHPRTVLHPLRLVLPGAFILLGPFIPGWIGVAVMVVGGLGLMANFPLVDECAIHIGQELLHDEDHFYCPLCTGFWHLDSGCAKCGRDWEVSTGGERWCQPCWELEDRKYCELWSATPGEQGRSPRAIHQFEQDALELGEWVAVWIEQEGYYIAPALLGWDNDGWSGPPPAWFIDQSTN